MWVLGKVGREVQGVASWSVEGFQARANRVPQEDAAEDAGRCDPSFCRAYRVYLESEDLGRQADSVSEKLAQEDTGFQLEPASEQRAEQPDRELRQPLSGEGCLTAEPKRQGLRRLNSFLANSENGENGTEPWNAAGVARF